MISLILEKHSRLELIRNSRVFFMTRIQNHNSDGNVTIIFSSTAITSLNLSLVLFYLIWTWCIRTHCPYQSGKSVKDTMYMITSLTCGTMVSLFQKLLYVQSFPHSTLYLLESLTARSESILISLFLPVTF